MIQCLRRFSLCHGQRMKQFDSFASATELADANHRDKPIVCTPAKMFPHLKLKYFIISVYGPHSYF